MENHNQKIVSNLLWRFAERFGAQIISFIVSIVLARLLVPEDYGVIALVNIFIVVLQVFVDSGMGNALIQRSRADDTDFSTVFFFNMATCILIYAGLFVAAPAIARFYDNLSMIPVIRVVGLTLVVSGLKNVQQAYVSKNMLFKKFFFSTLGGTLASAVVGVYLAYRGAGVWALVAQHLTNLCMDTVILWFTVRWRPKLLFSWRRFKVLFSFGWKLLVSGLIDTIYTNLRSLIIGKKYSSADLAFYNKGEQLPSLVVLNINASIGSVLFSALAQEQDDIQALKEHVRRAIGISSYLMWPMMVGLGVCAEPLVRLLLTDKWLPCVPYLQIACFTYGLMPIHTSNLQAITALGRSDVFLKLEMIKKVIGLAALLISAQFGVMAIAISAIVTGIISTFINAWPNRKLLNYSYAEQLRDMLPSFLLACVMGLVVYQVLHLGLSPLATLAIQIPVGVAVYWIGSQVLHLQNYRYILDFIKPAVAKIHKAK